MRFFSLKILVVKKKYLSLQCLQERKTSGRETQYLSSVKCVNYASMYRRIVRVEAINFFLDTRAG